MAFKHNTIVDLFTNICDKLRNMSGRPTKIKIDYLPYFFNNIMIGRFIVDDTNIPAIGKHAGDNSYYDTSYGVRIAYMPGNEIMVSMKGGTSEAREQIQFQLANNTGDNIVLTESHNTSSTYNGAKPGLIYACCLSGFQPGKKYKITADLDYSALTTPDVVPVDLVIGSVAQPTETINFSIQGTSYSCMKNMTWADFMFSEYAGTELHKQLDTDGIIVTYSNAAVLNEGNAVHLTSLIIDNQSYTVSDEEI